MDITLVFFIYGLAFFSMGLALLLETGRYPMLSEARVIIPLIVFGFLHGSHEWVEMFLNRPDWLVYKDNDLVNWLRISLLSISFSSLVYFGLNQLIAQKETQQLRSLLILAFILLYFITVSVTGRFTLKSNLDQFTLFDLFARYFLGVVGAILTGLALFSFSKKELEKKRKSISRSLKWAGTGFFFYAFTQTIVPPADFLPASVWNYVTFAEIFGLPVQHLRAASAILITICILRTLNLAEKERTEDLLEAQKSKVETLEKIRLELANREVMRQDFIRKIVVTQDEERARISRELHDETAQLLTAFSLNLAALKNKLDHNAEAEVILSYLQKLNQQISIGIYNLIRDLRPIQLDELGLVPAINYLTDQAHKYLGVKIHLKISGVQQKLDPLIENVFYRVAQEAINNIARHSGTSEGKVTLNFLQEKISMSVQDKGVGFTLQQDTTRYSGLGIAGMRERVEAVGGNFKIRSTPGLGTSIEVSVPRKPREILVETNKLTGVG